MTRRIAMEHSFAAELIQLDKHFDDTVALKNLTLQIPAGKLTALLGRNGAGKTTAIRVWLGLTQADTGEARLLGRPAGDIVARQRVGVMLQDTDFPEQLTVMEHLRLFASYYPNAQDIDGVLKQTGLLSLAKRRLSKLSGGEKRRVQLATALVGNPDLLLLDEPTAGLDVDARRELWSVVRELVADGKTVLLTTHYLEEADALADQVFLIDQGSVVFSGSADDLKNHHAQKVIRFVSGLSEALLQELPYVSQVRQAGRFYEVYSEKPETTLLALLQRDKQLKGLTVTESRLEDAFLALTTNKQTLRDVA